MWEEPWRHVAHLPSTRSSQKQFFSSTLVLVPRSTKGACHPSIVEGLMENGQGLSATWSTNSDLPHRSRQGCNFSPAECQVSPREVFPQELSQLNGPNFLVVNVLLVIRDADLLGRR